VVPISHTVLWFTGYKTAEERVSVYENMVRTNDGFEIAEADLKLRAPANLEGTQQSGMAFDIKNCRFGARRTIEAVTFVRNSYIYC
jgi:RecG-like helicase